MYEDPVLWAWFEIVSPKNTSLVTFFQLNTRQGTVKAPAVTLLKLNTLRVTKTPTLDTTSAHVLFI